MHHHGTAIKRCRPDPILLPAPLVEWLERPPPMQRYDACMCMGSNPGQPGKNLSKMISENQVKFELSTLRLDLSLYIYIQLMIRNFQDTSALYLTDLFHGDR